MEELDWILATIKLEEARACVPRGSLKEVLWRESSGVHGKGAGAHGKKKEIALWAEKRLDALLAITFVAGLKELRSRAEKLEDAEAELDDTCEYLAESVVTLLTRGRRALPRKREAVKAMLTLRAYDFFKVGDRILCILESEEAKTLAHLMGPKVEQEVCDFVADRRRLFPAHKPN